MVGDHLMILSKSYGMMVLMVILNWQFQVAIRVIALHQIYFEYRLSHLMDLSQATQMYVPVRSLIIRFLIFRASNINGRSDHTEVFWVAKIQIPLLSDGMM